MSMQITMPYGPEILRAELPWDCQACTLDVAGAHALPGLAATALEGFANPIGLERPLDQIVQPGERVLIIVSDSFRKTGIEQVLPLLLDTLARAGIREEDIAFLVATGTHRGPTEAEMAQILGEAVYQRFHARAFTHDPHDAENMVEVGITARGTRVQLNRLALRSDRVICTGAVVLHYFGGFGGGRKSILPGIASAQTIAQNHALNLHPCENRLNPAVQIGALDGNPVAEDMLEGAGFCRVDFLVNTVLNRAGEIAGLFCGELRAAHQAAATFARSLYEVPLETPADLVIASAGPAKNFIQSHKALFNAWQAMKPGGHIIFLARAPEGFGGNKFEKWLRLGNRDAIIAELRRNAEINGQTALSTVEKAARTIFVTELSGEEVHLMGGTKAASLEAALAQVHREFLAAGNPTPSCVLLPSASYTVPRPVRTPTEPST